MGEAEGSSPSHPPPPKQLEGMIAYFRRTDTMASMCSSWSFSMKKMKVLKSSRTPAYVNSYAIG